jgi:hypothetical protein
MHAAHISCCNLRMTAAQPTGSQDQSGLTPVFGDVNFHNLTMMVVMDGYMMHWGNTQGFSLARSLSIPASTKHSTTSLQTKH